MPDSLIGLVIAIKSIITQIFTSGYQSPLASDSQNCSELLRICGPMTEQVFICGPAMSNFPILASYTLIKTHHSNVFMTALSMLSFLM